MLIAVRMLFGNRLALSVIADAMPPLPRGEAGRDGHFAPKTQQKTFRRIKQKNIGKTVDIPDENGYYITVARPTQG